MNIYSDQIAFMVQEPFTISYDVGRDNIGVVTESFQIGNVIAGQLKDGKVRYNAVHKANGKFYNTAVYIDPAHLKETEYVPVENPRMRMAQNKQYFLFGISILFALILTKKS